MEYIISQKALSAYYIMVAEINNKYVGYFNEQKGIKKSVGSYITIDINGIFLAHINLPDDIKEASSRLYYSLLESECKS